jgi:hypothetical protein
MHLLGQHCRLDTYLTHRVTRKFVLNVTIGDRLYGRTDGLLLLEFRHLWCNSKCPEHVFNIIGQYKLAAFWNVTTCSLVLLEFRHLWCNSKCPQHVFNIIRQYKLAAFWNATPCSLVGRNHS